MIKRQRDYEKVPRGYYAEYFRDKYTRLSMPYSRSNLHDQWVRIKFDPLPVIARVIILCMLCGAFGTAIWWVSSHCV